MKIKTTGSKRLFENPILEALSRTSPYVIWTMYLIIISILLYLGVTKYHLLWWQILIAFLGGMVFWTFAEYNIHRYVYHLESDHPFLKRFAYVTHGVHHEYPNDKERLFLPPVPSLLLATLFFSLFYLILGKYAFAFFPGFVMGYLLYATTHYLIHTIKHPPKPFRKLWQHHLLHHYKCPDKAFGVSNMFWDYVFGTVPEELRSSKRSAGA